MWWSRLRACEIGTVLSYRLLAVFLLASLISGCGFHLRGLADFPLDVETIYIQTNDRYTDFYRALTRTIQENGLTVSRSATNADATVRVLRDETGRRALAVSARNVPREFEVYYIVKASFDVGAEELVAPQQYILTRSYNYDETQVLGESNEEDVLRTALAKDAVGLFLQAVGVAK
ncbi:MAG: hypothetical protein OEU86_00305 [Gammaproteobacteria bacterium]|nr:hypothetical protein [Gammaproteobacteria bacterium]